MPDLSAAANIIQLCQGGMALVGLVLAALWYFAPRLEPIRLRPALAPRWNASLVDTLVVGLVVFGAVFMGYLLASGVVVGSGLTAADGWTAVILGLGTHGVAIASVFGLAFHHRITGNPLPPHDRRPAAPLTDSILLGAAVLCVALTPVIATSYASDKAMRLLGLPVKLQEMTAFFSAGESPLLLIALTLLATVVAPLSEEILFRAGLFRILRLLLPRWAALLLSAMAFASLHLSLVHFVPLTVLGIVFALAYEKSGSLLVPVVAHALFNLNSILSLLAGLGGPS